MSTLKKVKTYLIAPDGQEYFVNVDEDEQMLSDDGILIKYFMKVLKYKDVDQAIHMLNEAYSLDVHREGDVLRMKYESENYETNYFIRFMLELEENLFYAYQDAI